MDWVVEQRRALYLPQAALWCDATFRTPRAFVSHAHSDHLGRHEEVFCTEATARFMAKRLKPRGAVTTLAFGQDHALDEATTLRLYPAGHILGSAQLWLEREGASLLYTGDFKLRPGLAAEACATPRADVLIMETTFGRPLYRFPPAEEVHAGIVRFCREALADGATPVLFGYSLGKSQEVLRGLLGAELPIMVHSAIAEMTAVYEGLGMDFPAYRELEPAEAKGHVVLGPPAFGRSGGWLEEVPNPRTATITGWAVEPSAPYRYRTDALFALSDHAGFDDLLRFVELVAPRRVYTVHGFTREFAATLRRRGIEAWALGRDNQLELTL